jgi:hypothetical protein
MSFSTTILVEVARQILIYGGLLMMLMGMFGSFMIILIFIRRPYNQSPCATYIIVNGILSFLFLPLYYLPNIVTFGFQINWLALNTPFCKFQMSYAAFTITSIFVINCFKSIDRYAISSRSTRIRSFSSKKTAGISVAIGLVLVWCLIGTPVAILFENVPVDLNGTYFCTSKNNIFLLFAAFVYYPILEGILPIVLATYFWFMTRKQVQSLNNQDIMRRFDKQITRMCLYQIIANAIASVPFATINLYRSLTLQAVRTESEEDIVQFFRLIAIWLFYIQYCSDFYIYITISSDTRTQVANLMCGWCRCWSNRVVVI